MIWVLIALYTITVIWLVNKVNYWYDMYKLEQTTGEKVTRIFRIRELEALKQVSLGNLKLTKIKEIIES